MGEGPRGAGASTVSGGTAVEPRGGFAEPCSRASGLGLGPAGCVHASEETDRTVSSCVRRRWCLREQTAVKTPSNTRRRSLHRFFAQLSRRTPVTAVQDPAAKGTGVGEAVVV